MTVELKRRAFVFTALAAGLVPTAAFGQTDPLSSWKEGATKKAILGFVAAAVVEGGPGFISPEERVAVFDMDGTLVPEKPVPMALVPIMDDIRKAVSRRPILGERPAVAALLKGDLAGIQASGEQGINDLIAVATDGRTTEELARDIQPLLEKTPHSKFGVPYTKAVYEPMKELLAHLEAYGFTNWICSGTPVLITREISSEMFGIPPERVMGSAAATELDERDGKTVLVFDGGPGRINDQENKPVNINQAIGRRPAFVGGNEGGRGDIAMMRWSKDRDGPSFQLLVNHDDGGREFLYSEPDGYSLAAARKYGFHVVSMRDDWNTVVAK